MAMQRGPGRRGAGRLVLVVTVLVTAALAAWMAVSDSSMREEISGAVGLFVGVIALGIELYLRAREQGRPDLNPAVVVDDLARIVQEEWLGEANARSLRDPGVLPLAWTFAAADVTDDAAAVKGGRIVRHRGGRLEGGFDAALLRVADAYRAVPSGRLVILGEPGAGKTVVAMMLALGLLAHRSPGSATPVLLSVSSWDPVTEDLDDWIVDTLATLYYAGRSEIPRVLLERELLIPILDGVDEIPESARRVAVQAINKFIGSHRPVVVTCRIAEYEDVVAGSSPKLKRAPVINVSPVTVAELIAHLRAVDWPAGTSWEPVFSALRAHPDSHVAQALSTPLMISVARTVYDRAGGDPAELLDEQVYDGRHAVEDYLIDRLVEAAYRPDRVGVATLPAAGPDELRQARQARRWLTLLARYLHRHGERDLAWWQFSQRLLSPWVAPAVGFVGGTALLIVTTALLAPVIGEKYDVAGALLAGAVTGGAFMVLSMVIWYVVAGRPPGRFSLSLRGSWSRLRRGFATGAALMAVPMVPVTVGYGVAVAIDEPTIRDGWDFTDIRTYALIVSGFIGAAALIGLMLAVHNWLDAPPHRAGRASPEGFLRQDRTSALAGASAAGVVMTLLLVPTIFLVMFIGQVVSDASTGWPGIPGEPAPGAVAEAVVGQMTSAVDDSVALSVLAFTVGPGVLVMLLLLLTRAWPRFVIARGYLALRGHLPWRLMAFLGDARRRQLLRQSGAVFQFRHVRLQERLAGERPAAAARTRGVSRRLVLIGGAGAATALIAGRALLASLPVDQSRRTMIASDGIEGMAYSPDGETLLSWGDEIRLWDVATGTARARPHGRNTDHGTDLAMFSADGQVVATTNSDGTIDLWHGVSGAALHTLSGHDDEVEAMAFHPRLPRLVSRCPDERARLWDTQTGRLVAELESPGGVDVAVFSPDGRFLATAGEGSQWVVLRVADTGTPIQNLTDHRSGVPFVAFSPDGDLIATPMENDVVLWNTATGQRAAVLTRHPSYVSGLLFSPDGQHLVTADDRGVAMLWRRSGEFVARLEGSVSEYAGAPVVFGPDSQVVVTVGGGSTRLLDGRLGTTIATLYPDETADGMVFTGDGSVLALLDYEVDLFSGRTGRRQVRLVGHTSSVRAMAVRPDGREIATASGDGTIKLWDLPQP